jgi:hypothetical protein
VTPVQEAALGRLIALMDADPGVDRLLVQDVTQHVLDGRTAGWELARAERTVQADLLDRPHLVDRDMVTGPLRDRLLRWLPTTRLTMISEQRRAAWDDVGHYSSLADAERVLAEEGLTATVERWEYDNGDQSVVVLDPDDGVLAEISTRHADTPPDSTIHLRLYCNYIAHDVLLWTAQSGGNLAEIRDSHGPTGVFVVDVSGVCGVRVPLVAMRAFGEFVRPWREAAVTKWFGGESALTREGVPRVDARADDYMPIVRRLERLTSMRVALWPPEVHDLLGPIHGERSQP